MCSKITWQRCRIYASKGPPKSPEEPSHRIFAYPKWYPCSVGCGMLRIVYVNSLTSESQKAERTSSTNLWVLTRWRFICNRSPDSLRWILQNLLLAGPILILMAKPHLTPMASWFCILPFLRLVCDTFDTFLVLCLREDETTRIIQHHIQFRDFTYHVFSKNLKNCVAFVDGSCRTNRSKRIIDDVLLIWCASHWFRIVYKDLLGWNKPIL